MRPGAKMQGKVGKARFFVSDHGAFALASSGSGGPENRRMICAGRNAAEGRSHSAAERGGRERSEDGAVHPRAHNSGVCAVGARSRWEAQSPRRKPHQEGVTETSVSVEMGASKTVPRASTREETSSLQIVPILETPVFRLHDPLPRVVLKD